MPIIGFANNNFWAQSQAFIFMITPNITVRYIYNLHNAYGHYPDILLFVWYLGKKWIYA